MLRREFFLAIPAAIAAAKAAMMGRKEESGPTLPTVSVPTAWTTYSGNYSVTYTITSTNIPGTTWYCL